MHLMRGSDSAGEGKECCSLQDQAAVRILVWILPYLTAYYYGTQTNLKLNGPLLEGG